MLFIFKLSFIKFYILVLSHTVLKKLVKRTVWKLYLATWSVINTGCETINIPNPSATESNNTWVVILTANTIAFILNYVRGHFKEIINCCFWGLREFKNSYLNPAYATCYNWGKYQWFCVPSTFLSTGLHTAQTSDKQE